MRQRFNLDEAVVIGVVVNGLIKKLQFGDQAPELQNGILILRAEMPRIVIVGARSIEGQVVPIAVDAGRSRHLLQLCGGPSSAAGTGGPTAGFRIPIGRGDRARIAPDQTANIGRVANNIDVSTESAVAAVATERGFYGGLPEKSQVID